MSPPLKTQKKTDHVGVQRDSSLYLVLYVKSNIYPTYTTDDTQYKL